MEVKLNEAESGELKIGVKVLETQQIHKNKLLVGRGWCIRKVFSILIKRKGIGDETIASKIVRQWMHWDTKD